MTVTHAATLAVMVIIVSFRKSGGGAGGCGGSYRRGKTYPTKSDIDNEGDASRCVIPARDFSKRGRVWGGGARGIPNWGLLGAGFAHTRRRI